MPSNDPTIVPTSKPTTEPTERPSDSPTNDPTHVPSFEPTNEPTGIPTNNPTKQPSNLPTVKPTDVPTSQPTGAPTSPTKIPTTVPSNVPTNSPTSEPTGVPTNLPTILPTIGPVSEATTAMTPILLVKDNSNTGKWYLRLEVRNLTQGISIDYMSVRNYDRTNWVAGTKANWGNGLIWIFRAKIQGTKYVAPLDVNITANTGEQLVTYDLIDSFSVSQGYIWNFGQNFVKFTYIYMIVFVCNVLIF